MKLSTDFYLKVISQILAPLVRWSISLGIGYRQFSRVIKPLFYQAALQELTAKGLKFPAAIVCTERDEPAGGTQRLRIGVYFYTTDTKQNPSTQPAIKLIQ